MRDGGREGGRECGSEGWRGWEGWREGGREGREGWWLCCHPHPTQTNLFINLPPVCNMQDVVLRVVAL